MAGHAGFHRAIPGALFVPVATLALCLAATSRAAPVQPVRLVWARAQDADSCAGSLEIKALVAQRLGFEPFSDDAPRTIETVVERLDGRWVARLHVRNAQGRSLGTRVLTSASPDCESIQSAAVLAIALAIDPNARILPVASAWHDPPASSSSAPPSVSSAPPPAPPPPVAPVVAPPRPEPVIVPAPLPPPDSQPAQVASLSLRGGLTAGLVPGTSPAAGLTGGIPVGSSFSIVAHSLFVAESRAPDDRFAFGLSAFGLGTCWQTSGTWTAGACFSGWLGSTWAVVHAIRPTHPGGRAYTAVSLEPYVRLTLIEPLHVELAADLFVPVYRRSFTVTGWQDPAWTQPAVAGAAFLGIGLHFR